MLETVDLTDATLVKEFSMGCLTFKSAHLWPLSNFTWESSAIKVGATFVIDAPEPWDEIGLMRIEVFKLPKGKDKLADSINWYLKDRKSRRIRIRDGELFDQSMLHVKGLTNDWEQDSFATHKGGVVRIYRRRKFVALFRFAARSGTLLDHPVFKRVAKNTKFNESLWEREVPVIIDTRPKTQQQCESDMTDDQEEEMWEAVEAAMDRLNFRKIQDTKRRIKILANEITSARKNKELDEDEAVELAYELGYMFGQMLAWELDWEWCNVETDGEEVFCVCSPNRGVAFEPVDWIYELITQPKLTNNCQLLWNMISSGRMPPSRPYSYVQIC